ncbi:MAG TPA: hypothetical protein VFQ25_06750 [Ktedonobacterales bacterium]|nr:hypothetical protein [Ktedonobacterales bacterium]
MRQWWQGAWWQGPVGLLLGWAVSLPSDEVAAFIPSQWRALAVWGSLAIALAAAVSWLGVKRFSWLFVALIVAGLSYSVAFAYMQGWDMQASIAMLIVAAALTIGLVVAAGVAIASMGRWFIRQSRQLLDITHEIGEKAQSEGAFRDDGERIIVHVNRGRLLLRILIQGIVLTLFVGGYLWARTFPMSATRQTLLTLDASLPICFVSVISLLSLTRLMMRSPTLIINADGTLDNCSLIVAGRGLLRWSEILGVMRLSLSLRPNRDTHLYINLTNFRAVRQRQPLWKRALAFFAAASHQPLGFRISPALLDQPAAELVNEISRYIKRRAPEGGWRSMTGSDRVGIVTRYINTHAPPAQS